MNDGYSLARRYQEQQAARGRNHGEHPSYGGQAVVVLEGPSRQAIKQLANALKGMQPIPAIHAAKQFDFPGVYIFSEASGEAIYVGESKYIPRRLKRHFGKLHLPVALRSTPHRAAHREAKTGLGTIYKANTCERLRFPTRICESMSREH